MSTLPAINTVTIEEATERLIDYRGKTPPKTTSGVRLVTAKVVKGGQIHEEPAEFIAADFYDEWMRRGLPQQYDVLLTTEAPLGEVALLRSSEKIALAQRIILLRAKPGLVDPIFLFYALRSNFGQGELRARASGTTVLGIKQSELRQVRIPIFPLPVQRRIAGILSAYDELIENSQRRIRLLEDMARALYREWFVHFRFPGHEGSRVVEGLPEGWNRRPLEEVAESRLGKMLDQNKNRGELMPYLANVNVRWGEFDLSSLREMRFEPDELETFGLKSGDIVMCEGGEPGRCAIWKEQVPGMMIQKAIHRIRCRENMDHTYLYQSLRDQGESGHLAALFTGATIKHLPREKLAKVKVVVPPASLLKKFRSATIPMEEQVHTLQRQIQNLRRTRDLLLPRLLSGQVALDSSLHSTHDAA
jgi:type I restriction enzyme S subunit